MSCQTENFFFSFFRIRGQTKSDRPPPPFPDSSIGLSRGEMLHVYDSKIETKYSITVISIVDIAFFMLREITLKKTSARRECMKIYVKSKRLLHRLKVLQILTRQFS